MNQFFISPQGQLLGPQGQPLGYTVVQTPQGIVAVPNQLHQQAMGQLVPQHAPAHAPAPAPAPAQGLGQSESSAKIIKVLIGVGVLYAGYKLWKKFTGKGDHGASEDAPRFSGVARDRRARRSRSRLLGEVKRFLETHPEVREEFREEIYAGENAREDHGAGEDCGCSEDGACEAHEE